METRETIATVKGPAEWFTGEVFIDALAQGHGDAQLSVAMVHFSPGSRTAWHCHALGQTLYVSEGEGRIQSRGQPAATIRPGEVVFTPGNEWHWHGASSDRFMTHLSVAEGEAQWGEHVTDSEYGAWG